MTTRAKICYGYTSQQDLWIEEETYLVNYDGYPENILPILKAGNIDKFEQLEHFNEFKGVDFIYYVDDGNKNKIRCTVLEFDWAFYNKYSVDNYKVVKELIL